jgi:hypothetical protein
MDEPARFLGERHRSLRHTPLEVLLKYWDSPEKALSGLLHILADKAESEVRGRRRCRGD